MNFQFPRLTNISSILHSIILLLMEVLDVFPTTQSGPTRSAGKTAERHDVPVDRESLYDLG